MQTTKLEIITRTNAEDINALLKRHRQKDKIWEFQSEIIVIITRTLNIIYNVYQNTFRKKTFKLIIDTINISIYFSTKYLFDRRKM